jgi:hypothetical protein
MNLFTCNSAIWGMSADFIGLTTTVSPSDRVESVGEDMVVD